MTDGTAPPARVRIARHNAVCGVRGCLRIIEVGSAIVKPGPGQAWRHLRCDQPSPRRRHDTRVPGGRSRS
jgi:hypothetical protein